MGVFINQIATAVPPHDIHQQFVAYAPSLLTSDKQQKLFGRMAARAQIDHRYSFFSPGKDAQQLDGDNFYQKDNFPDTAARMQFYEQHAFSLATMALDQLDLEDVTHLIITSCTGFYAPGLDLQIIQHYGLPSTTERSIIGFMGCYAAINALKLAYHITRSTPAAKVAVINLELCTLHLQDTADLESVLSFLIFADGCAASIISAKPQGLKLQSFYAALLPDSAQHITWHIGQAGFNMVLSGQVPPTITKNLPAILPDILHGHLQAEITHWAIHPGGRSILDAIAENLDLPPAALDHSRAVLREYGNMSSATLMFVLQRILAEGKTGLGCAMAFGPGITLESMMFHNA